jgi:hypothetical protein
LPKLRHSLFFLAFSPLFTLLFFLPYMILDV